MCHLTWQDPRWERISIRKHRKANKWSWERSIATAVTGEPDEPSQFDPNLTDDEIERMQLDCVRREGTLIRDECHKRTFFRRMGAVIGASAGVKTEFIFVEYVNSGLVHGWPITEAQLEKKRRRQ